MRSNGWNSLGVSSGSFFRSRGLGSGERMLLHPLRVDQRSPLLLTGNAHDGRASNTSLPALVRAISTHLASQYLPATSRSPPPTLHMSTPRAAQLSLHRPGGSAAHTHTSRALTVHSHPPRGDSHLGAWCLPHVAASAAPLNTFQSPWSPARWSCPWSRAAC